MTDLRSRMMARRPRNTGRWYDIRNATGPVATVRIYDEIGYWGVTAADFVEEISAITAPEIEVQINSPGGDVFDGLAIYNALRLHKAKVTTRVDGLAASAASVIVQAGDRRIMVESAQLMIHEAWGVAIGPADEMREFADLLDQQNTVIAKIYASASGRDVDEFLALMEAETWLTDEAAVEAGLADEVLVPAASSDEDHDPATAMAGLTKVELEELVTKIAAAFAAHQTPAPAEEPPSTPVEDEDPAPAEVPNTDAAALLAAFPS